MRFTFMSACAAAVLAITPVSAMAANSNVENVIKADPDLSSFTRAMTESGVLGELEEGHAYTVFAPTNAAFAEVDRRKYPCFNVHECKDQMADILRSHVVPGVERIGAGGRKKGGVFSLDHRFVNIGQPSRNTYSVSGQRILRTVPFTGGILYVIDGLIVNKLELQTMEPPVEHRETKVTKHTIPDPACGPEGCPDSYTETTTITRTVRGSSAPH